MAEPLRNVLEFLQQFAPLELAEAWDNVGLLVGDVEEEIASVMTCLTLTPDVAAEAISEGTSLIVSHHPLLFRPIQRLTTENVEGSMLLSLIQSGIAIYSPHTAFDSARLGINQWLAERLELTDVAPLRPRNADNRDDLPGSGRYGNLRTPMSLGGFLSEIKRVLGISYLQYVGDEGRQVSRIGVACGSAAEFLPDAVALGCEVLLTGEARFHACLEARNLGAALVLAGHYATERPGVEQLAIELKQRFHSLRVWPSKVESDPVFWSVT